MIQIPVDKICQALSLIFSHVWNEDHKDHKACVYVPSCMYSYWNSGDTANA